MKKAKVYSAEVKGVFTQIKAHKKVNAIARFKQLDGNLKASDVKATNLQNSHQSTVEELFPEICS